MSAFRRFANAARSRTARTAAVVLIAAAGGAGAVIAVDGATSDTATPPAATTPAATSTASNRVALTARQTDFSDIYAERSAGVVSILAASSGGTPDGGQGGSPFAPPQQSPQQSPRSAAEGSGVVIDSDGHILTNEHVVSGADSVTITFASGATATATVVGTDPSTDLALLKVDVPADQLTVVPLGDSDAIGVGDPVLAIGSPFGYQGTATAGIVSGLGRSITSPNGFSVPDAIQTDAAINHGNSGGALLNDRGELVGIPAQIADSGVNANVGVAFAIPVNTAKRVVSSLESSGTVDHAWLGVSAASVNSTLKGLDGVGADSGALITGLAQGGPAAGAGLVYGDELANSVAGPVCTGGDVITAVDGTAIHTTEDLQAAVDAHQPGESVELTVVNAAGTTRTVSVTLATQPETVPQTAVGCG